MNKKLSQYERAEYLNVIKTILTKENWKKFKEKYKKDNEMIYRTVKAYHILNRDKEKINKWFELNENQDQEIFKLIDRAIELRKKSIEKLENIKNKLILDMTLSQSS